MGTDQPDRRPLVVHTDWSRAWGGQEIRILTELREMRQLGFRVALIVPHGAELAQRGASEGFPVHTVSSFAKFNLQSWRELHALLREIQPTVINTHSSEDSWMAGALARLCRVPLIIRTRHVLAPISSSLSYKFFPHLIFTCSDAIAQQLVAQGVPADKNVVLSTGVDEERFRFSPENRKNVRNRYGIGENEILVGNVGFLRHYKGHDFIVKTAAAMPAQYRFMIVGGGGELPSLQALTRKLGVEDRMIFAGHHEQPEEFFSAFDLFFFSSYEAEGISQALVQSLLNGLPVLACRIPSTTEPLRHIQDHRLVDYADVAAACQGLMELQTVSRCDRQRLQRQHQIVADLYGLRRMVATLVATYARHGIKVP